MELGEDNPTFFIGCLTPQWKRKASYFLQFKKDYKIEKKGKIIKYGGITALYFQSLMTTLSPNISSQKVQLGMYFQKYITFQKNRHRTDGKLLTLHILRFMYNFFAPKNSILCHETVGIG